MRRSVSDFFLLGLNHETCPVEHREALSFPADDIHSCLSEFACAETEGEMAILSTCNRTEIYTVGYSGEWILDWLSNRKDISREALSSCVYQYRGLEASRHLFSVASGLDSMVLGETQITGQLKNAIRIAEIRGTVGPVLRPVFDASLSVSKAIRSNTAIGESSVSLPAAALRVSKRIFDDLRGTSILFIGAGEMIRLSAEYFVRTDFKRVSFTNRTLGKAKKLATVFHGDVFSFDEITPRLHEYDIVVSCTGSATLILETAVIESSMRARRYKPVLFIDLAVPRDIDNSAVALNGVFVYSIDDLGKVIQEGKNNRIDALQNATKFIDRGIYQLTQTFRKKDIAPVIKAFRKYGEDIAQTELERALEKLSRGENAADVLRWMSKSVTSKFLDQPSRQLVREGINSEQDLSDALIKLHGLKVEK